MGIFDSKHKYYYRRCIFYKLIKHESGIEVKIREEVNGLEQSLGEYSNVNEAMNVVEEYKEKVEN